ncbi:hypothetical protein NSE01_26070 [Novosphingobium sediminis]|uniref:DUF1697 domain-containing protein n=1 Tax=Novosphingobium sediminis TaxID=707214 RepID=A0A512AM45_9SPHN|nr:DUF1697 domain-containing protein [Novosphingobium sediminis]GEO00775.1 hypothetical protein NSE01_26070 [Novosphingobium sediminis]
MPRYVALLGSINVGGNRLTMAELRAAFESEGLANIETVVASGNVLFDHDERPTQGLEEKLERLVRAKFDMRSFVAVRSAQEVRSAVEDNPFTGHGADAEVHTVFLDGEVDPAQFRVLVEDQAGRGPERLAIGPRALYIDYVGGVAASRLTGAFLERRLGRRGTARNVRSLARILAKMG